MALSANRNLKGKVQGRTRELVIKSGVVIYTGALVCCEAATAQAILAAHGTANLKFMGVAIRGGTGNAGGTVTTIVESRGTRWLPHNGTAVVGDMGKLAYAFDDEKVETNAATTTNDYIVGKIVGVDTANNLVEVDLEDRVA